MNRERIELGRPHRGPLVFALGILAWLTCLPILSALAWAMGTNDLALMRRDAMDPAGEGMTQAGRVLGMVHLILGTVLIFVWYLAMLLMGGILAVLT